MNHQTKIIELIDLIRHISQKNLPETTSFIPYDLLVYMYSAYSKQQPVNLKELFLQFQHSEMGVRFHLQRLMDDGRIYLVKNPKGGRSKVLVMSPRFIANMEEMLGEITSYIEAHAREASRMTNTLSPNSVDKTNQILPP